MKKSYYLKKCLVFVLGMLVSVSTFAQWNSDGHKLVTPETWEILDAESLTHTNGNSYVFYNTAKDGYDKIGSYLQIVDPAGNKLLGEEGLLVSGGKSTASWTAVNKHLFVDKDGNAVVVIPDFRHSISGENYSYSVYKISPSGEFLWGADGIDLNRGTYGGLQVCMNIVQLEDGSYAFAWTRYPDEGNATILLERLSSTGEFLWDNVTVNSPNYQCTYPYLVNAGNNQVVLVYAASDAYEILARKIDFDGSPVWAKDVSIYKNGFTITALQVILKVYPDPNGGVFVAWYDDRDNTNVESVYLSYIKPNGSYGFVAGGEGQKVGYSGYRGFYPDVFYNKNKNAVYVGWRETSATQNYERVMLQKLTLSGELLWTDDGVEVAAWSSGQVGSIFLQADNDDNVAVFYMQRVAGTAYGLVNGYVSSYSGEDGSQKWSKQIIKSDDNKEKSKLAPGQLVNNSWTASWKEASQNSVYLTKVSSATGSGIQTNDGGTSQFVVTKESSTTARFTLNMTGDLQSISLDVYDLSGKKMVQVYNGKVPSGKNSFFWNISSISHGVYIGVLKTANATYTQKIVL